jgi:hypothetical protein
MLAFVGPPPKEKPLVMHLDDNPLNNNLSNLRYGSNRDNFMDSVSKGRKKYLPAMLGASHPKSKKVYQFSLSGEFIAVFNSSGEAQRSTGFNQSTICHAIKKKIQAWGFLWSYSQHLLAEANSKS